MAHNFLVQANSKLDTATQRGIKRSLVADRLQHAAMITPALLLSSLVILSGANAQGPAQSPSGVTISANISSLNSNSEFVSVSVSGVSNPTIGDAIAYITDAGVTNYTATPPQKFKWLVTSNSSDYLTTGSGNVTLRVLNTRLPFKFLFVTNITNWSNGSFNVVASTPAIPVANPNSPTQVRLALTNITGQAVVSWTTANKTQNPVVQYGTQPGVYTANASAAFDQYTRSDMCGGIASAQGWIEPGVFNNVLLKNLSSSTKYYYVVGDPAYGVSREYSFTTPPSPGSSTPVTFFAIADLGYCETDNSLLWEQNYPNAITTTPPTTTAALKQQFKNIINGNWLSFCAGRMVAEAMAKDAFPAQLLIHNGDISYANGFEYAWEVYHDQIAPLVGNMPYMVVEGNHERDWPGSGDRYTAANAKDSGGECGVPNAKRFPMPFPAPEQHWYAFGYGPVYFVQLSTELDFSPGSPQFNFVFNQISTVNRTTYPWLVVGLHRPYFEPSVYGTSVTGDLPNQRDLQDAFDDIFVQYGVDMTLFGHTHWYSRSCPVYKKNCILPDSNGTNLAPVHVNIGNAGASFSQNVFDPAVLAQNMYAAAAVQHGYARINATRTSLTLQAVNAANGQLIDQFTLTRPEGSTPNATANLAREKAFLGNVTLTWQETYSNQQVTVDTVTAFLNDNNNLPALQQLAATNPLADPVKGPTAYETYEGVLPFFTLSDQYYQQNVRNANTTDATTRYFYNEVYGPLQNLRASHPNGVFKGPYAQYAPAPAATGIQPASVLKEAYDGPGAGSGLQKSVAPGVDIISSDEVDPNAASVSSASLG